ncbi:MAG: type II CAAX endopeptidase family protein [Candidatus Ancaeobacter aquaticus]|nr:type II CAAX endopeptidase family protein [Candidatus Ancaeobacter aquaticus]
MMDSITSFFAKEGVIIVAFLEILLLRLGVFALFILIAELLGRLLKKKDYKSFNCVWSVKNIVELFVIYTGFQALMIFFKGEVSQSSVEGFVLFWSFLEYIFLIVLVLYFVLQVYEGSLRTLGLITEDIKRDLVLSLQFLVYLGFGCAFLHILHVYEFLKPSSKIIESVSLKTLFAGGAVAYAKCFLVLIVSPFAEEVFYRGFMYPVVRNKVGPVIASLLISLFFAFIHFDPQFFVYIFILSYVLCYLYEKGRSLVPPIIIHSVYNLLVLLGLFNY